MVDLPRFAFRSRNRFAAAAAALLCCVASPVLAQEGQENIVISAAYTADVAGVVDGGAKRGARYLDNVDIVADLDLDGLVGWSGAKAHFYFLNNLGGRPNDLAGTVQGVDNIEVGRRRAKLYEAWVEQSFLADRAALLVGFYDLNSEFYANDASGLLIAPPFGIGSELAATGPNGPSIFSSTALAARLRMTVGKGYAMAAVFNAKAGSIGDRGGVDTSFNDGVLAIAEAGHAIDGGKLAIGAWTYSKRQLRFDADLFTPPLPNRRSHGAYVLAEARLAGTDESRAVTGFVRAGLSDGRTSPFKGGWQTGLLIDRVFAGRPDSQFSIGIAHAYLSSAYRRTAPAGSPRFKGTETGFEITYSDRVLPFLTLQPDVQYIRNPAGDRSLGDAVVLGLRATFAFDFAWSGKSAGHGR